MASRQPMNRANFSSPLFSEAIIHGGLVYCSGKVGRDLLTGKLVGDGVAEQTTAALKLLESVLRAAGSDITMMLKCNIYLTDMHDLEEMNSVYMSTIPDPKPARICMAVGGLGAGAKVEIDCVAALKDTPGQDKLLSRIVLAGGLSINDFSKILEDVSGDSVSHLV